MKNTVKNDAHKLFWEKLNTFVLCGKYEWSEYVIAETKKGEVLLNFQSNDKTISIIINPFTDNTTKKTILIEKKMKKNEILFEIAKHAVVEDIDKLWNRIEDRFRKANDKALPTALLDSKYPFGRLPQNQDNIQPQESTGNMLENENREEMSDLIGNTPGWLLRSGISLIFLLTLLIAALSYFIKYPDTIEGIGILTTERPPLTLQINKARVIEKIMVAEGSKIEAGTALMYLKSDANKSDIESLSTWIKNVEVNNSIFSIPEDLQVGTLQSLYTQLILTYKEYHRTRNQKGATNQIRTIEKEIGNTDLLNASISSEEEKYLEEIELIARELKRSKELYENGAISKQAFENTEAKYSQSIRQQENWKKTKIQNEIRKDQLKLESLKLTEDRSTTLLQYEFKLDELVSQIESELTRWYKENHIIAEMSGTIEYHDGLSEKGMIQANTVIGFIIPQKRNNHSYIKVIIDSRGISEIDRGTRAIIKFDAYPYKEYGVVEAKISAISRIPYVNDEGKYQYQVKINLPETIETTYNKLIEYKPNMTAETILVSEDKSIFHRILSQFLNAINNG